MIRKLLLLMVLIYNGHLFSQTYQLKSPDGNTELNIDVKNGLNWSLLYKQSTLVKSGRFNLIYDKNIDFNKDLKVSREVKKTEQEVITSQVSTKFKQLNVSYNKLILELKNKFAVEFRLYDNGFAYRITGKQKKEISVNSEDINIEFPSNARVLFPKEESIISHNERLYIDSKISDLKSGDFASLPLLVQSPEGYNLVITDADLYDYPCMFLEKGEGNVLKSKFPKAVLETKPNPSGPDRNEIITKEADYIAKTSGNRNFPWRVFAIAKNDAQLLENQLVFNLSRTPIGDDFNWVKPGKVAWDWWNANNIYGVDFKSGINTETYKYYIDFASEYGLEYIILDEGWTKTTTNILETNPEINMPELMAYAKSKNVQIILWTLWKPLYEDLDKALDLFSKWGAAGVKVDFMQRSDQQMVKIYEEITKKAAEKHLLVDFHGAFKPSGLRRAYPNLLSYEGVKGLENVKWSKDITPDHNLNLPFIRMLAGPMDYTPGAMRNKNMINYSVSFTRPQSMGTRAHQVALYVAFESPLQMLCDNPSNYRKEEETARFIAKFPTIWDKTMGIDAKIGDYLILARRKGDNWYIGGLTDWKPRDFEIDLSFLGEGTYMMELLEDGVNADKFAEDYRIDMKTVKKGDKIKINMASGGGFAAIITPVR